MNPAVQLQISTQTTQDRILALLADLPPEGLTAAEQFVRFLREYAGPGQASLTFQKPANRSPHTFPTVCLPATSLDAWLDLVPAGYVGDALTDTEAIYDEV